MATVEVILKQKIEGLGAEADVVKVKRGFARNFLLPQDRAYEATKAIAALINEKSKLNIDRHQLVLESPIKTLGSYDIPVKLHPSVEASVTVRVIAADGTSGGGEAGASDED